MDSRPAFGSRTPGGAEVLPGYLATPDYLESAVKACERGKLYATLSPGPDASSAPIGPGGPTQNEVRNQAIEDLKTQLLAAADIQRQPGY